MNEHQLAEQANAEYQRQIDSTDAEQRSKALYVAVRAFQAALAIEAAEVTDYMALLELLETALGEYGDAFDAGLAPVH